jgi:hypothetical protein
VVIDMKRRGNAACLRDWCPNVYRLDRSALEEESSPIHQCWMNTIGEGGECTRNKFLISCVSTVD